MGEQRAARGGDLVQAGDGAEQVVLAQAQEQSRSGEGGDRQHQAATESPGPARHADIVAGLGGADNISEIEGCITRLRTEVVLHAFVVLTPDGVGLLVHLGIDTVHLGSEGFTLHRAEGDDVAAGAPVVSFDVALVRAKGLSAVCPVVVLDSPAGSVFSETGGTIDAGAPLFACSTGG